MKDPVCSSSSSSSSSSLCVSSTITLLNVDEIQRFSFLLPPGVWSEPHVLVRPHPLLWVLHLVYSSSSNICIHHYKIGLDGWGGGGGGGGCV